MRRAAGEARGARASVRKGHVLRTSALDGSIITQGYLEKLSSGLVKRWQKRYFVTTGHYLNYSESEQDAQTGSGIKSSIDLVSASSAVSNTEKKCEFTLNLADESLRFKAETEEEAECWVTALESFIMGSGEAMVAALDPLPELGGNEAQAASSTPGVELTTAPPRLQEDYMVKIQDDVRCGQETCVDEVLTLRTDMTAEHSITERCPAGGISVVKTGTYVLSEGKESALISWTASEKIVGRDDSEKKSIAEEQNWDLRSSEEVPKKTSASGGSAIRERSSRQGSRGSRRPKLHGTLTRNSLHKKAMASLRKGEGSLKEAVKAPVGEQLNEWHAVNLTNFYNDITLLFGVLEGELCTADRPQCASMCAGPHQYLWADGVKVKKPVKCSAAEYMEYLQQWTEEQLDSHEVFPTEPSIPFPENFVTQIKTIFKRLFRAYAHMYHSHFDHFVALGAETHLNTCFKHFIVYVNEHGLMQEQDQAPLKDFIPKLISGQ
jgi:MOB kinase activator 1